MYWKSIRLLLLAASAILVHPVFGGAAAVRGAVLNWRFTPARRKATRVSQVVELGFYFGFADLPSRVFKDGEIDVFITAGGHRDTDPQLVDIGAAGRCAEW